MRWHHRNYYGSWLLAPNNSTESTQAIVVVGSINADLLAYVDDSKRIGNYVFGDEFRFNLGGKGLNQALNVAASGQPVLLIGRVGDDSFGHEIVRRVSNRGVKTSHIIKDRIAHTGIGHVRVSIEGEYDTVVINGANSFLDDLQIDAAFNESLQASYVLMNYEILSEVVAHAADRAHELGIETIINLSPIAEGITYSFDIADYLILNEDEARSVLHVNEDDTLKLAKALQVKGAKNVIVTKGSSGVLGLDSNGQVFTCERVPVTVENTIGAGDTFLSCFALSLNAGKSFKESLEIANYSAALACTKQESFLEVADLANIAQKFEIDLPPIKITEGTEHFHD